MEWLDPVSGKVVWSDKSGLPAPGPRADGQAYIKRGLPGPAVPKPERPATMDMILNGTGITERVDTLNKLFNPMVAMHDAGKASQKMLDPNTSGWGRVGAFGEMAGNMASVLAPVAGAKLAGGGAEKVAKALTDSLTGISLPEGEIGRFMADEFGGVKLLPGQSLDDELIKKYPGVSLSIQGGPEKGYTVSKIVVPKDARGSGIGTAIMRDLIETADEQGATVKLSPSADFGGNVARLRDFYKRFGFVENKGRNADYAISESMYRQPRNMGSILGGN